MDNQAQYPVSRNVIEMLYHTYRSACQDNSPDPNSMQRKVADDAEDALLRKLADELKKEMRQVICLRAEVNELDAANIFADGFVYGAELILNILRPEKPG